jgi:large subunit ribosomal protein L34
MLQNEIYMYFLRTEVQGLKLLPLEKNINAWYSNQLIMPKRTYQPKTRKRARVHGFMKKMSTRAGRLTIKRRRLKGRTRLSA